MAQFACKTTVVSGEGALETLGRQRCRKMLVAAESGQEALVQRVVRAAGNPKTVLFDRIGPVASMQQAVAGSSMIRESGAELVVALGGENVLDCGKAMACFSRKGCLLAAIPTAFGTGSEVTDRVTLEHNGRRHLLWDEGMRPALALLDSGERFSGPETAEGGFSLLAAALEAYSAADRGLLADIHAREAFASVWAVLPAAFAGREQAGQKLQRASVLTGLAVEATGLGLCRALENSLGTVFGLSRGKAAAIVLPAIVGCNGHAAGRRYAELSRAAGLGGSREEIGIRNLKAGLIRLRRELGLPGTLVQAGVDLRCIWNQSRQVVTLTLEDPECRNNPVAVDDFLVRRILEEITGRL